MLNPQLVSRCRTYSKSQVGGSSGNASIAIATAFPKLNFIVQNLPDSSKNSKANIVPLLPESIQSRVQFEPHNFFEPQERRNVDVFLLRIIIHDWRDPEASTILKHLIKALSPGGKIIITDTVMPTFGAYAKKVSKTHEEK